MPLLREPDKERSGFIDVQLSAFDDNAVTDNGLTPADGLRQTAIRATAAKLTMNASAVNSPGQADSAPLPEFSENRKWLILAVVSLCGLASPMSSHIYFPALLQVQRDLKTTEVLVSATVSVYVFFMGIAPMAWATFADVHGRRQVYLVSLVIYAISTALCGVSVNIWMLMVMRVLQAAGSSSVIAVGAGTIGDIFSSQFRGTAMGLFFLGPLLGPLAGPVIGGYISESLGWRAIFYILGAFAAFLVLLVAAFLPETLASKRYELLHPRTHNTGPPNRSIVSWFQVTFAGFNPLRPLLLLRHPAVAISILYLAVIFSSLYAIITLIPRTFLAAYPNLTDSQLGLLFLSGGIGNLLGALTSGRLSDALRQYSIQREQKRLARIAEAEPLVASIPPEYRLASAFIGAVIVPASLLAYGWIMELNKTGHVSIFAPLAALFFLGFGNMYILTACNTFLVDAFPENSASAVSCNNLARSVLAALATLAAVPWQDAMGTGWMATSLAIINIVMSLSLIPIMAYGRKWHEKRESALCELGQFAPNSLSPAHRILAMGEARRIPSSRNGESAIVEDDFAMIPLEVASTVLPKLDAKSRMADAAPLERPPWDYIALTANERRVLLGVISACGMINPLPALLDIQEDLGTSAILVDATISVFMFVLGVAPLFWSTLSDAHGRRYLTIASLAVYAGASAICGTANSIGAMMLGRVLQAAGSSAISAIGPGIIRDVYGPTNRGSAMGVFLLGLLLGTLIGPIFGGYINQALGWRVVFYILGALGAILAITVFVFVPETLAPLRMPHGRRSILRRLFHRNPFRAVAILKNVLVLASIAVVAAAFGSRYVVTTSIPRIFKNLDPTMTSGDIGLLYIPSGVGNVIGAYLSGKMIDILRRRASRRSEREMAQGIPVVAESRIVGILVAATIMPVGLLLYGWCLDGLYSKEGALVGIFLVGMSVMASLTACNTFLIDAFPTQASSAVAVANFARFNLAGVGSLVSSAWLGALGVGWVCTTLTAVNVVGAIALGVIYLQRLYIRADELKTESVPEGVFVGSS